MFCFLSPMCRLLVAHWSGSQVLVATPLRNSHNLAALQLCSCYLCNILHTTLQYTTAQTHCLCATSGNRHCDCSEPYIGSLACIDSNYGAFLSDIRLSQAGNVPHANLCLLTASAQQKHLAFRQMLFNKRNGSFVPCGLPPEELPCHVLKAWVSSYHTDIGCRRLQSWAEGMITEEQQRGFGNGISCNLANSSLKGLSELASKAECEVHICCVDFGKAYKNMARHLAWQLFKSLGFSYMVLQFITDLCKDTMCATQTDNDTPAICS